ESDAVVANLKKHIGPSRMQVDLDLSLSATRKSVFERIGNQFIDNQPARDRGINAEGNVLGMNCKNDVVWVHTVCCKQAVCKSFEVFSDLDSAKVSRLVELFVEQSDGADTTLAFLEKLDRLRVGELIHLEVEHA